MTLAWVQSLEFTHPSWLVALLVLAWGWWWFRRSLLDFAWWQRVASACVRAAIVVLLVLALAGLTWLRPTSRQFVVVAVDQSLSVRSAATTDGSRKPEQSVAEKYLTELLTAARSRPDDTVVVLPFAATADRATNGKVFGSDEANATRHAERDSDASGTDIAGAIEAAAAIMPPDYVPRMVLLTDGNQTRGDALRAASNVSRGSLGRETTELQISTVPLPVRDDPEVQVSAVNVPAQVREGEPFHVEVVIDSNHDDEALIEVFRGAHKVVSESKPIKSGENRFRFAQTIQRERLADFSVRISGLKQDAILDNNSESGLVFTSGQPRVLLIDSEPKLTEHLVFALQQEDIQVDVRPPQGLPEVLADLQNYELLAISNVPATSLTRRQMELARTYVQDLGGGLVMLGGDQSFGLGGYYKTVLEEILPVRCDFEKEKEKPGLAMVLVIDRSGSMAGQKLEMAKEAAKAAAELLGPKDQLGVICFDENFHWVSELQSAGSKTRILDQISSVQVGGGTSMFAPMEEAYQSLVNAVSKLKHVIVLTDGISNPGDFEGLASSMASSRITCTTVGVGDGAANDLLATIARIGQGRHFVANDPASLPQIFAKETLTVSKAALNEQPFIPQLIRPTPALTGIEFETAPFLLGYVLTKPKPTSELILASEQGDPVLAWWRYGLGTTVAFTSDATSRWAAEWLSWPGFSQFWAQTVRHAMRKNDARGVTVAVAQQAGRATVTLDAIEPAGRFVNGADAELTVIDPRLGERKLAMSQSAPGRYVAEFDTPHAGAYHVNIVQRDSRGGTVLRQQSRGLTVGYSDELRLRSPNTDLLRRIANVTGGRFNPSPSEALIDTPSDGSAPRMAQQARPLWPELLMLALLLFVLDVALRRIDLAVWIPVREFDRPALPARAAANSTAG